MPKLMFAAVVAVGLSNISIARADPPMQPIKAAPSTPVAVAELSAAGGPRLAPTDDMPPDEIEAFVDGVVQSEMRKDHIAGVAVSVVQSGRLVFKKGYGFASLDPATRVDPDKTLFRIGSITKTFTWILLMKAVEEGKIDLDAPVNKYLPADLQIPTQGFKKPIRVRDLMTHSPGFEDRTLGVLFAKDPDKIKPLAEWLRTTRPNRVREPGELSSYSNYGAALAGAIVANVEGWPWQELVEAKITQPLELAHTSPREPYPARADLPAPMSEELAMDFSRGFIWKNGSFAPRGFAYITPIAPAGVISSTVADMSRYMLMLLGNGKLGDVEVFGDQTARAFRTPMTHLPAQVGNWDAGFIDTVPRGGWHAYGHSGGTLSFFTNMILVPDLRLGVFVATNTRGGSKLSEPLPALLASHFYAPPLEAPARGSLKLAEAARMYQGEYTPTRRPYGGLDGFISRVQKIQVTATRDGGLLLSGTGAPPQRLVPLGKDQIFVTDRGSGGVQFELKDGHATRLITLSVAADRASLLYRSSTLSFLAVVALVASFAAIIGLFIRFGRNMPVTKLQGLAGAFQCLAAALWVLGAFVFAVSLQKAIADPTNIVFEWPSPLILTASSAALAASLLSVVTLGLAVPVWTGASGSGWSLWRKARYSLTVLIFCAFALILGLWGALAPWNP